MNKGDLYETRGAYGDALVELGEEIGKQIVVLDADLSGSTRTSKFAAKFPEQFINMGIAEQDMMGTAAGLALSSKTVFASTFAIFAAGRPYEQIRNSIAYSKLDVKIVASHGGISVGPDGSSHQAIEDISLMRAVPNMRVVVPCDARETISVIKTAAKTPGPFYIRVMRPKTKIITEEDYEFKLGKSSTMRAGSDITMVACGLMVEMALDAAEFLSREGIECEVINCSTIKPIDEDTITRSTLNTGACITLEENTIIGGLGSAVAETLGERNPVPMLRIGIQDKFGQSGTPKELMDTYGLNRAHIVYAVRETLARKVENGR
ncbi:MAG: putative transketolase C-terminal section [Candidatus Thorarchaeota archaeon]|nr:MAG: putative transketolase C-terminal section [Candidatus Thorarchaeota archaeon]